MLTKIKDWAARNRKLVMWLGGIGVVAILLKSNRAGGPGNYLRWPSSPPQSEEEKFTASLPSNAKPYAQVILRVAREEGISPQLIFAIGEQESRWGQALSPAGPGGTGDGGHGHGIMQIDDRSFGDWLLTNNWTDPYTNVKKGVKILKSKRSYLASRVPAALLEEATIAAYNTGEGRVAKSVAAGLHPDATTAGGAYSANVYRRIAALV